MFLVHLQSLSMHLKAECMMTQVAVQDVIAGCKEVFGHTVVHKISDSGFDTSVTDGIFEGATNPFSGLESQYLQEKFITQHCESI